jgi:acyl-coenzyme A thioesterase PaaI-like protein
VTSQLTITVPAGFPAPGQSTVHRRLLDGIVAGTAAIPPYIRRLALPSPTGWSPGRVVGATVLSQELMWREGVVFGGYAGCLTDLFAGLAMTTLLPSSASFLTAGMAMEFVAPLTAGATDIVATVRELSAAKATVEVLVRQRDLVTSRGTVTQIILNGGDES